MKKYLIKETGITKKINAVDIMLTNNYVLSPSVYQSETQSMYNLPNTAVLPPRLGWGVLSS